MQFKIVNITRALPVAGPPADRFHTETGGRSAFTDDTGAKFRTGMKFSLRYNNRSGALRAGSSKVRERTY